MADALATGRIHLNALIQGAATKRTTIPDKKVAQCMRISAEYSSQEKMFHRDVGRPDAAADCLWSS